MDLLKIGGVAYFQTIHCCGWRAFVPNWFVEACRSVKNRGESYIPVYGVRPSDIEMIVRNGGGCLKQRTAEAYSGWKNRFLGDIFLVVKDHARS